MKQKKLYFYATFILVLIGSVLLFMSSRSAERITESSLQDESSQEISGSKDQASNAFDAEQFSLTNPSSVWFVANKHFSLPQDYVPANLVVLDVSLRLAPSAEQMQISDVAAEDLIKLFEAAEAEGLQLQFGSGYRSASLQKQFYDAYVATDGESAADTYSARPGHSEHQTGLAIDFTRIDGSCHLEACFGELPEGTWLAQNAHLYGFILRYPENLDIITGYTFEPWHFRYVGIDLATEMYKQNIQTLEEFFELAPATTYL